MNKIKYFMLVMMAFIASATFTACSSDDDNNNRQPDPQPEPQPESNYQKYQKVVNETVNSQKKSNKVILLVAFGSTWEQAYDTFDKVVDDYKANFPGWDVFLSFSSAICINNARAGENVAPRDYYDPEHFLTAIGLAGYKQIVVQSLQVIPGEEYRRVRDSKKTEVVTISSLKQSSQLRDPSPVSCLQVDSLPLTHLGRPWTPLRHTNLYVSYRNLQKIMDDV